MLGFRNFLMPMLHRGCPTEKLFLKALFQMGVCFVLICIRTRIHWRTHKASRKL